MAAKKPEPPQHQFMPSLPDGDMTCTRCGEKEGTDKDCVPGM